MDQTRDQLKNGTYPSFLASIKFCFLPLIGVLMLVCHLQLVPLHRHSSLPELQSLVSLFKPKRLVPNFLEPQLRGLDWACLPLMFGPYMAAGGADAIRKEIELAKATSVDTLALLDEEELLEDVHLSNLEGGNEARTLSSVAEKWGTELGYDGGRLGGKIRVLMAFLPKGLTVLVDSALRKSRMRKIPERLANDDGDDSSSDDESHGQTAALIFAPHRNSQEEVSPETQKNDEEPASPIALSKDEEKGQITRKPNSSQTRTSRVGRSQPTPKSEDKSGLNKLFSPPTDMGKKGDRTCAQVDPTLSTPPEPSTNSEPQQNHVKRPNVPASDSDLRSSPLSSVVNILEERSPRSPKDVSTGPPQDEGTLDKGALGKSSLCVSSFFLSRKLSFAHPKLRLCMPPADQNRSAILQGGPSDTDMPLGMGVSVRSNGEKRKQPPLSPGPLSPESENASRKRLKRERSRVERFELSQKLSLALPDLAVKFNLNPANDRTISVPPTRAREATSNPSIDWERCRTLEKSIARDIAKGRMPVLPRMSWRE